MPIGGTAVCDLAHIMVRIFVVPEIVYERCRPESRRTGLTLVAGKTPKKQRARSPQSFLFMDERFDPRIEDVPEEERLNG